MKCDQTKSEKACLGADTFSGFLNEICGINVHKPDAGNGVAKFIKGIVATKVIRPPNNILKIAFSEFSSFINRKVSLSNVSKTHQSNNHF